MLDSMISAMASNYANFFGANYRANCAGAARHAFRDHRSVSRIPDGDRDIVIAVASTEIVAGVLWGDRTARLAEHPDYATNALRVKNREVLEPLIASIFRSKPSAHWVANLRACGIPCAPVKKLDEVGGDPQAAKRGMFQEVGGFTVTGPPVKLSATPGSVPRPAPHLGEHTREALAELLGLSESEIEGLVAAKIVSG